MRVAIIGNSGSGKSTLARHLSADRPLATLDLDTIAWEPGQIAVPRPADRAVADVHAFCQAHDAWIVEGCYRSLIEAALAHGAELVFLNPGRDQCVANCRARPWEHHKYASKEDQDSKLDFLLQWVSDYYTRDGDMSLASHEALFARYPGPKRLVTHRTP